MVNTIPVESIGNFTKAIAITPDGKFVYVTNLSNVVSVIDTCTNTVVDTITVGFFPVGVAITPNGDFVYITNSGSNNVSVIDTSTNLVVDAIPVGNDPVGIAITPNSDFAYVTNAKSDNVSVIDTTINAVVDTIPVGDFPQGIAITPNGNFAYVANQGQSVASNKVSVIDTSTNTVVDTIPIGDAPLGIAIENISFPCPTPFDSMCIETTRIFDSCMFKEEQQKTFELPKDQDTQCEIIETKCSILDISKIDDQQDYELSCTVKVTAIVRSNKLVQIEVPLLKTCEPRQC